MQKHRTFLALLVFMFVSASNAIAFLPRSFPLYERVEESDIVGVVKVLGVRRGQPPLLEVEIDKLYKGDYVIKDSDTRRIFIDLKGVTSSFNLLDPSGSGLAKYRRDPLHFVFLKQSPIGLIEGKRVMKPMNWTFETMLPIRNNLIAGIGHGKQFRSTHDYLSAVEQLVEIDNLQSREQKMNELTRLKDDVVVGDNPYLSDAVRGWLLSIEGQIEREKATAPTVE